MRRERSTRFAGRGGWPGWFGVWIAGLLLIRCMPRGVGPVALWDTIWDAGWRWKPVGNRDDTEVAVKDACVLGLVGLKREYSQLFVLFLEHGRIKDNTGDVHCRVGIVEGWNGPRYAGFA